MNLNKLIRDLEAQQEHIDQAIRALRDVFGSDGVPKHAITPTSIEVRKRKPAAKAKRRTISPEGRARIAAAQKARWKKLKRLAGQ